ncbi:hypothetical protein NDU88_007784 [Pleurodeles waltl]|uniref:Secreted protein n=1 Tax=Pleurodeles waltl TaxID=8319 RepID=A0AAV7N7W0_PLEWA|nr:hypothetical protein NDU88_007784 [Pleurodeles waltl]
MLPCVNCLAFTVLLCCYYAGGILRIVHILVVIRTEVISKVIEIASSLTSFSEEEEGLRPSVIYIDSSLVIVDL